MTAGAVSFPKLPVGAMGYRVLMVLHLGSVDEILGPVVGDIPIRPVPNLHPVRAGTVEGKRDGLVNLDLLLAVRAAQNYLQPAVL